MANDGEIVNVSARAANTLLTAVSRLPCRLSSDAMEANTETQQSSAPTELRGDVLEDAQWGPMAAADGCSQPASGALQRAV
jgi:hypothetical protein